MSYKLDAMELLKAVLVQYAGKEYRLKFGHASCQHCEFLDIPKACQKHKSDLWCNQFVFEENLTLSEKLEKL